MTNEMADVLSISDYRADPHMTGEVRCMACGHEWIAVCPSGTTLLDCPQCQCTKGFLRHEVLRDGELWVCHCGNDLFHMTPNGIYCPHCGDWQKGF
jgi:hypothetical protein